ncbi:hypothetical protein C8R43DRAFT_1129276 [Mycena crocata]|nr:hypothetical protein C8R43DRAFT_1129276 [Mycena crocata]
MIVPINMSYCGSLSIRCLVPVVWAPVPLLRLGPAVSPRLAVSASLTLLFAYPAADMIPATYDEVTEVYLSIRRREPRFPGYCYGFLYASGCVRRRRVAVPYNYGVEKISSPNDLFVHVWVPRPTSSPCLVDRSIGRLTISHSPGTNVPLEFKYSIIYVPPTSPIHGAGELNQCVELRGGQWFGNILVVKHGKRKAVINMEQEDTFLVDNLVSACIEAGDRFYHRKGVGIGISLLPTFPLDLTPFILRRTYLSTFTSMVGQGPKKRKTVKNSAYRKEGKRMRLRSDRESESHVAANSFFYIPELFLMELLQHCDLFAVMALSKTGQYGRDLVKAFFTNNLRILIAFFISYEHIDQFYIVLEASASAIAGSVTTSVLTFPYRHDWLPANLNIIVPKGHMFMWRDFFDHIGLPLFAMPAQVGVDRRFQHSSRSHIIYCSKVAGFTIHLTESLTNSVMTPLMSATTTFATNLATASDFYSLYTFLLQHRRALEGWFPTPVRKAVTLGKRRYRSSFSTTSWKRPCGLNCPVLIRSLEDFKGVGVFRYGGPDNRYKDNSPVGVPEINANMTWNLGDVCNNKNCDSNKGTYFGSVHSISFPRTRDCRVTIPHRIDNDDDDFVHDFLCNCVYDADFLLTRDRSVDTTSLWTSKRTEDAHFSPRQKGRLETFDAVVFGRVEFHETTATGVIVRLSCPASGSCRIRALFNSQLDTLRVALTAETVDLAAPISSSWFSPEWNGRVWPCVPREFYVVFPPPRPRRAHATIFDIGTAIASARHGQFTITFTRLDLDDGESGPKSHSFSLVASDFCSVPDSYLPPQPVPYICDVSARYGCPLCN